MMVFDSLRDRMGGHDNLSPQQIAHNTLFTATEKIELLHQLQSQHASNEGDDLGFSAEDIDAAIAQVRQGAENNVGASTVLKGDF